MQGFCSKFLSTIRAIPGLPFKKLGMVGPGKIKKKKKLAVWKFRFKCEEEGAIGEQPFHMNALVILDKSVMVQTPS